MGQANGASESRRAHAQIARLAESDETTSAAVMFVKNGVNPGPGVKDVIPVEPQPAFRTGWRLQPPQPASASIAVDISVHRVPIRGRWRDGAGWKSLRHGDPSAGGARNLNHRPWSMVQSLPYGDE